MSQPAPHTPDAWKNAGRNDPCPCGSGKKFKKCCSDKVQIRALAPSAPRPAHPSASEISVVAITNQGSAFHAQGRFQDAIAAYRSALALNPRFATAWFNLGMAYFALDDDAMFDAFGKALALEPENAVFHQKICRVYHKAFELRKAVESAQRAVALQPDFEEGWITLAESYFRYGDTDKSAELYERLTHRFPNNPAAALGHACALPHVPASADQARAAMTEVMRRLDALMEKGFTFDTPDKTMLHLPFYHSYYGMNVRPFMSKLAEFCLKCCPALHFTAPHCRKPAVRKDKIRVGFLSEFFHTKTLNQFYLALIEKLTAREEYEVVLISSTLQTHESVREIAGKLHSHIALPLHLPTAQPMIAQAELDMLIYLEVGMSHFSYFMAFARLAPVQCVMAGHPITTGIPNMDYMLSMRDLEPEDARGHYTEKLVLFDNLLTIFHRPEVPQHLKPREALGMTAQEEDARLYLCPVMLFKLHPDMDRIFAEILRRDPKARILLPDAGYALWSTYLRKRMSASLGAEAMRRIVFIPFAKKEDFFHLLRQADCVLDTFHFSFGTTAYLCLAADVPFVTWPGEFLRGRGALGLYKRMGMTDLVAPTHEAFIELALKLANDKAFRAGMQEKIRQKSGMLFSDESAAEELGMRLKQIYDEACGA